VTDRFHREIEAMFKRLGVALVALLIAFPAFAGGVPQVPSSPTYSEASQIVGTLNAIVNQLNGVPSPNGGYALANNNNVSLGSLCQPAAGASPLVCNGQRMVLAYTGLVAAGLAATGTVATLVATNSSITAQSACVANWMTAFTAGSGVYVSSLTPTAGSLSIVVGNAGTTTNAVTTGTLVVNCFN
jgi:hypothetical protein